MERSLGPSRLDTHMVITERRLLVPREKIDPRFIYKPPKDQALVSLGVSGAASYDNAFKAVVDLCSLGQTSCEGLPPSNCNAFGRLNGRMHELEDDLKKASSEHELLDDAANELILADDDEPVRCQAAAAPPQPTLL